MVPARNFGIVGAACFVRCPSFLFLFFRAYQIVKSNTMFENPHRETSLPVDSRRLCGNTIMDGKPLSQFKLARLQAQQEKEAAACNARQTQTPSAATPAGVADPKEAASKEAAAATAGTRESSHKVAVQQLEAQKRQFPPSTISTEAGHGAHQQPTGGHRRQSDETVEDKVERYMGFLRCSRGILRYRSAIMIRHTCA